MRYRNTTYLISGLYLALLCSFPWVTEAQDNYDRLVKKGLNSYINKKYDEAISYLSDAIEYNDSKKEPYVYLVASCLRLNKTHKAILWADSALLVFPDDLRLLWLSGESYLASEDFQAALQRFRKIKTRNMFRGEELPENTSVEDLDRKLGNIYKILGAEAFTNGNNNQAVDYFTSALEYLENDLQSYINLAYLLQQREEWRRSIEVTDSGLEKFPENPELIKLKAQAYYHTEDHENLLEEYRKLYQQDPDDIEIALAYAEVLLVNKKLKDAVPVYDRLMEEYPEERRVYEALINVNEQFQNPKGKIQVLRKMVKHFPEDTEVYKSMASSYAMLEKWDDARHVYDTMVQLSLASQWANHQIARTYVQQDSLKVALNIYREMMEKGNSSAEIRLEAASVMEQLSLWKEALDTYNMIRVPGKEDLVLTRKGNVLEKLGRPAEAIKTYQKAVDMDTDYPSAYFNLARLIMDEEEQKAFELTQSAVVKSLNKLKTTQTAVLGLFEGEEKEVMRNPVQSRELAKEMERYEGLSERIFGFMTENFPEKEVENFLDRVVNEFPGSGKLFFLTGNFYLYHNRLDEAIAWYQRSLQRDPELLDAHLAIGRAYRETGEQDQAILAFERAMTLDDQIGEVYSALIDLNRAKGALTALCNKWMARYRARPDNRMLREHLIEALHKDGQYELAKRIVNSDK